MEEAGISYSFKVDKRSRFNRYLEATIRNNAPGTLSVRVNFKRCRSNGVITQKCEINIYNIDPGETMQNTHDLFWILDDWNYAEVTSIDISEGRIVNKILKTLPVTYRVDKSSGPCFVATACFGEFSDTVTVLRTWRDHSLVRTPAGRVFITLYGIIGPHCAAAVSCSPKLRYCVAMMLKWIARQIDESSGRKEAGRDS